MMNLVNSCQNFSQNVCHNWSDLSCFHDYLSYLGLVKFNDFNSIPSLFKEEGVYKYSDIKLN